jgi:uncharacterized membrane protein
VDRSSRISPLLLVVVMMVVMVMLLRSDCEARTAGRDAHAEPARRPRLV